MTDAAKLGEGPTNIEAHRLPLSAVEVPLDIEALNRLRTDVGIQAFDEVFEDAVFEVTERLARLESLAVEGDIVGLGRLAHDLIAVAAQIGLSGVSQVAEDLRQCCEGGHHASVRAVCSRLLRIGEDSLVRAAELSVDICEFVEGA